MSNRNVLLFSWDKKKPYPCPASWSLYWLNSTAVFSCVLELNKIPIVFFYFLFVFIWFFFLSALLTFYFSFPDKTIRVDFFFQLSLSPAPEFLPLTCDLSTQPQLRKITIYFQFISPNWIESEGVVCCLIWTWYMVLNVNILQNSKYWQLKMCGSNFFSSPFSPG